MRRPRSAISLSLSRGARAQKALAPFGFRYSFIQPTTTKKNKKTQEEKAIHSFPFIPTPTIPSLPSHSYERLNVFKKETERREREKGSKKKRKRRVFSSRPLSSTSVFIHQFFSFIDPPPLSPRLHARPPCTRKNAPILKFAPPRQPHSLNKSTTESALGRPPNFFHQFSFYPLHTPLHPTPLPKLFFPLLPPASVLWSGVRASRSLTVVNENKKTTKKALHRGSVRGKSGGPRFFSLSLSFTLFFSPLPLPANASQKKRFRFLFLSLTPRSWHKRFARGSESTPEICSSLRRAQTAGRRCPSWRRSRC